MAYNTNLPIDFVNVTLWILVTVLGVLACSWALFRRTPRKFGRVLSAVRGLVFSSPALVFLIISNSACAGFAIYMSYVAPQDIMLDIASVQELLKGNPFYSSNMGELVRESMQKEPPRLSLGRWSRRLREKEAREQIPATMPLVQAHPPLMILVFAPLVASFGVRGTCLAVSLLSVLALFLTDWALFRGLDLHLSARERIALAFGTLGWYPVISDCGGARAGFFLGG